MAAADARIEVGLPPRPARWARGPRTSSWLGLVGDFARHRTLGAIGAVVIVVLLETFVFSPRILGRMMELHPVLIMAILPLAQYFFGIWGLILATPVAVYVIHVLILGKGLPGIDAAHEAVTVQSPARR